MSRFYTLVLCNLKISSQQFQITDFSINTAQLTITPIAYDEQMAQSSERCTWKNWRGKFQFLAFIFFLPLHFQHLTFSHLKHLLWHLFHVLQSSTHQMINNTKTVEREGSTQEQVLDFTCRPTPRCLKGNIMTSVMCYSVQNKNCIPC